MQYLAWCQGTHRPTGYRDRVDQRTNPATADDGWGAPTTVQSAAARSGSGTATVEHKPAPAPSAEDTAQWRMPVTADAGRGPKWRNLPAWGALLVLVGFAAVGAAIEIAGGKSLSGVFNYSIIIGSVAAVLLVRRSAIFPIIIAPPLVYAGGSVVMIYTRSSGLSDRRVLYDAAANWLVYGFPTMAAATALVLIIAGIRLIIQK